MALISSIGEVNLDALDKSIADTAVDIFVYDTRKDSDGGKWRKRTKKTSWYNEELNTATRGSRREFPAVAVIVISTVSVYGDTLTIYDGDDPDLPMWMVFQSRNINAWISGWRAGIATASIKLYLTAGTSVVCKNGKMIVSHNDDETGSSIASGRGVQIFDFNKEIVQTLTNVSYGTATSLEPFVNRNIVSSNYYRTLDDLTSNVIINSKVNDVAMTVLPNAPIDPATGLPTPTIAVATNGGVSVIKDDGTIVDLTCSQNNYNTTLTVAFNENNDLIYDGFNGNANNDGKAIRIDEIPSADKVVTTVASQLQNSKRIFYYGDWYNNGTGTALGTTVQKGGKFIAPTNDSTDINFGESIGVSKVKLGNSNNNLDALVCGISSSYNTGWMHGDIKGAFLSDTDATNVTGTELITNGTFDTDTSGWAAGNGGSLSVSSGKLVITVGGDYSYAVQSVSLDPGTYVFAASMPGGSANGRVRIGKSAFATQYINGEIKGSGSYHNYTFTVVDQTTTVYFTLICQSTTNGQFTEWDDISVRIAEPDRSVNAKGLQVFGTITKSPVAGSGATAAELVAYSGFSSSNYLTQPYNSDLNYGINPFYVMTWFKTPSGGTGTEVLFSWRAPSANAPFWQVYLSGTSTMVFDFSSPNGTSSTTSNVYRDNTWHLFCGVQRSQNRREWYIDGELVAENNASTDATGFSSSTATLKLGVHYDNDYPYTGSLCLFRTAASAPTAEQIKKIYEDEKVLFQENAKCTLYGSSDAVTALAYDDKTNLLHVGTSSGRSDFKGLRRINNTTTGITTAISASNRLIAEQ